MAPPHDAVASLTPPGLTSFVHRTALRVALTVIIPAVWVSLTLVYVAFFAPQFTAFQDFVLVVVSFLALVGTIVAMWVAYGVSLYHRWADW